jgi:hypothetical protein
MEKDAGEAFASLSLADKELLWQSAKRANRA